MVRYTTKNYDGKLNGNVDIDGKVNGEANCTKTTMASRLRSNSEADGNDKVNGNVGENWRVK